MLLDLPQELRDQIFSLVCLNTRLAPGLSTYRREYRRTCERQSYSLSPLAGDRVWFERPSCQNPMLSLLLVNRQVNREVQEVLRRVSESPNYAIDVVFLKDGTNFGSLTFPSTCDRISQTTHIARIGRDHHQSSGRFIIFWRGSSEMVQWFRIGTTIAALSQFEISN